MTLTTLLQCNHYGQLGVRIAGPETAEPLVLIHGVGMQSAAWGPQIEALQANYRVYAVDMPGHGQSSPLAASNELARMPEYIEWFDAVLDCLDLDQVNLAGHSMGAVISATYASTHPQRVQRVALVNCIYNRPSASTAAVQARAAEIRAGKMDLVTPLKRWFRDIPEEQALSKQVVAWLSSVDMQGYGTAYTAFAHSDDRYADKLKDISCPLLAITGDGDPNSTDAMSIAIAEQAQNAEAVVIKDHRHMINITAPERVNDELKRWLQKPKEAATLSGESL